VISAFNLSSRDNGSESDPYLIVSCGNRTYNERKNYQSDEPNPEFYKMFEFDGVFPGCGPLVLKMMDYDDIFGDEAIGTTYIDLEDRYFSPEWQSIKNKPVEYRQLYHPSSSISQGTVKLWVTIIPTSIPLSSIPNYDIAPKPAEEFEVRVVIFDTVDVKMMDVEGTSDVYCRAFFDSGVESKETDTHYRCSNGKASFNYRMLFNLKHPRKDYKLSLQLYDRDFFKSNDMIGDTLFDVRLPLEDVSLSKRQLGITKTYYNTYLKNHGFILDFKDEESFWLPVSSLN
jgi:Ca2+-dependent lipid-binding protein